MFQQLFKSHRNSTAVVKGRWCLVRACVDMAAQEWLNVGVIFYEDNGVTHTKFITNLSGIQCIYDEDAADSLRFLLDQAEYAIETNTRIPDGWNVALSQERFVQGSSVQSIVDDLFMRLVPLGKHQLADRTDREEHQHATKNVRRTVRQLLASHLNLAKSATPEFWRKTPYPVQRDGTDVSLDLQIVANNHGLSLHGAVTSAWYKTKYHRTASLSQAVNAINTSHTAFPKSNNFLYLLKPPTSVNTLSSSDHREITKEIEASQWMLQKHHATLRLAGSEAEMALMILQDLHLASRDVVLQF